MECAFVGVLSEEDLNTQQNLSAKEGYMGDSRPTENTMIYSAKKAIREANQRDG